MKINKSGSVIILVAFVAAVVLFTGVTVFVILTTPQKAPVASQNNKVVETNKTLISPTVTTEKITAVPTVTLENIDTKFSELDKEAAELDKTDQAIDVMN